MVQARVSKAELQELQYDGDGFPVNIGDQVMALNQRATVRAIIPPLRAGSTGRVVVQYFDNGAIREHYPSVIGASWKKVA